MNLARNLTPENRKCLWVREAFIVKIAGMETVVKQAPTRIKGAGKKFLRLNQ